ncbi:MAG: phage major capsid protein [Acholeplasmatales bacterium]|nr:phage major capsid protein [Acholeplasmatales bacterium]
MSNIYLTKYASAVENALKLKPQSSDFVEVDKLRTDGYIELPIDATILSKYNLFRDYMDIIETDKSEGILAFNSSTTLPSFIDENNQAFIEDNNTIETKYKAYKLGLLTKVKLSTVNDIKINMTDYLKKTLSKRYGKAEENVILNGTGVKEPLGLLNYDLGCVSALDITYDSVIDLFFSLNKDYRDEAVFITNDETALKLRKLKDGSGQYLWNTADNTILGKKVLISNYMTTPSKPILFGNFTYITFLLRERIHVKVLSELYAENGEVGYASKERLDFKLTEDNAVKVLILDNEEESQV